MSGVHPEVLLATAYATFLLAAALVLELLARHSHGRSERYRTAGFRYHRHLDAWECSEGHHLARREDDHERRLARYRGRAHVCNACAVKEACTDSDVGRELVRAIDPWPHSDVGRFHRGVSLALVLLAALVTVVEAIRHHQPLELAVMAPLVALIAIVGPRLVSAFRSNPSTFPQVSLAGSESADPVFKAADPATWQRPRGDRYAPRPKVYRPPPRRGSGTDGSLS